MDAIVSYIVAVRRREGEGRDVCESNSVKELSHIAIKWLLPKVVEAELLKSKRFPWHLLFYHRTVMSCLHTMSQLI